MARAASVPEASTNSRDSPKCLPKDGQKEIRGKLHPRSGAERADALDATAELFEQGPCASELGRVAAREPDQRP